MTTLQPTPQQSSRSGDGLSFARRLMAHCDGPILAAIVLGAVVRAFAFGDVPPGMHQDEASAGYDAYALLYYGIDRNGFHNPAGLIAWGSGMFALVSYVAMPFIALLGLTPIAVRLPFLVLGVASILMLAWLVKEIHGRTAARIAAFLLAIAPGPILMSRWALDANLMPPVLLAGVLTMVLALRHAWLLPLSFALFGLSLYAYGTAYIVVPVMLAMIVPYALAHRRMTIGPLAVALLMGALVAAPALLYALVNFFKWDSIVTPLFSAPRMPGPGRYETVGNFDLTSGRFFQAAFQNVCGAVRLFVVQFEQRPWNTLPGFGEIYVFSLPFTLTGLVMLCRTCLRRPFSPAWYMFAWCVATAVVTLFVDPSLNHLSVGILPKVYCTALGLSAVYERWRVPSYGIFAIYTL
jgi:4-amino-4-deoxy-L-arabinose transferase-like glycosyltransferase